jgi:hypothetical protein
LVPEATVDGFGVSGYPSSFLIGPDGRILWAGHPAALEDGMIEGHIEKIRLFPGDLPAKLAPIEKATQKGKYGEALTKVTGLLNGTTLNEAERAAAEKAAEWIRWYGTSGLEGAAKDATAGKVYEAWQAYEALAQGFKGNEVATQAAKAVAAILADKDQKREVDAGKRLDKVREQAKDMDDDKAAKLYEGVADKYEGTRAGARAAELARALGGK